MSGETQEHRTVGTWQEFREAWDGVLNFRMVGDCVPFALNMPPVEQVVDEIRRDPDARIWRGAKGGTLDKNDIAESFRKLPIEKAVTARFQMSHFKLTNFCGPGKLFHGFEERVMEPWRRALVAAGFTWTRCYPIVFISGLGCATNYHLDYSHVLAWQLHGTKRFSGLRDPDRWAPLETRVSSGKGVTMPEGITEDDTLVYEMKPGDVLWNALLTPHWVEASDTVAYSINISHGGLRLNGRLCRHEQELEDWRKAHPEEQVG
jgi:hypothetical protein